MSATDGAVRRGYGVTNKTRQVVIAGLILASSMAGVTLGRATSDNDPPGIRPTIEFRSDSAFGGHPMFTGRFARAGR